MTHPISIDSGIVPEARRPRAPQPHLVCSWNIDPTSMRLCCVWMVPTSPGDLNQADRFQVVH
jgi:hypothetical protein